MDEALLKSNFVGRDGFRWWIGQIPPIKDQGKQHNGAGWGHRFKVRIMGYHPVDDKELSNEDLPWAQVLLPATAGSGGGNRNVSVLLTQGDVVFGFFLDGDNAQIPVIVGAFGKTNAVSNKDYSFPFSPFTGYTDNIKKPSKTVLIPNQAGDANAAAQKSPIHTSPSQAAKIGPNEVSYSSVIGDSIRFANPSSGSTISKINTEVNNLINFAQNVSAIAAGGGDFAKGVISYEIGRITSKIQDIVSGLVNGMVSKLYKALAPLINQGLKMLYQLVYNIVLAATGLPPVAHQAGVAAQKAMVGPVTSLQQQIPSLANTIINGLGGLINSILTSTVNNMNNFSTCAGNQFTGVLANSIIGQVSNGLSSAIGAIGPITQFFGGFSIENTMRNTEDILGGFGQLVNAGQKATNYQSSVNEWTIGRGPKSANLPSFNDILKTANDAYALATSVTSPVSESQTFASTQTKGAVKSVKVTTAGTKFNSKAIGFGTFDPDNLRTICITGKGTGLTLKILETSGTNGAISQVEIVNPGKGYNTGDVIRVKAPSNGTDALVTISSTDNSSVNYTPSSNSLSSNYNKFAVSSANLSNTECYTGPEKVCNAPTINLFGSDGSGATAVPILGNIVGEGRNRTGSIIGIKVTNRGSGYDFPPFVEIVDNCNQGYGAVARAVLDDNGQVDYIYIVSEGENYPVGDLQPYYITGVNIIEPGIDYVNGDIIIDNFGNQYSAQVLNGEIVKVDPLNIVTVTDIPILTVVSEDGGGAILSPIIETLTNEELLQKQLQKPITDQQAQEQVPGRKIVRTQGQVQKVIECIDT